MKLKNTYICINCEELFTNGPGCPSCSSKNYYALARWFNSVEALSGKLEEENIKEVYCATIKPI